MAGHRDLLIARVLTLGPVALAFPVTAWCVFGAGMDRNAVADGLAWVYSLGIFAACTTALWPLSSLRDWSRLRRARSVSLLFLGMSYVTHLTWELGWLLLHRSIREARDSAWAYPWWAYIDGGDARYRDVPAELLGMEVLSVTNGLVGGLALLMLLRRERDGGDTRAPVLVLMGSAVVHLYSASLYFLSELFAGMPNVDTSSFTDTFIKFTLANAPWLVFPFFVFYWASRHVLGADSPTT